MKTILCAALVAATISAPVHAQEHRFPGFHLEAVGGFDAVRGTASYEDTALPADNFAITETTSGAIYGVNGGVDVRVGDSGYVGVEGGYEFTSNSACEASGTESACFALKRNMFAGVRAGTPLTKRDLFYVGGAYVNSKAKFSYTDTAAPADNFSISENRGGWRVSVGVEHRLVGNAFAKLEYRYTDYADYVAQSGTETYRLGFSRHQGVAGIGARF